MVSSLFLNCIIIPFFAPNGKEEMENRDEPRDRLCRWYENRVKSMFIELPKAPNASLVKGK